MRTREHILRTLDSLKEKVSRHDQAQLTIRNAQFLQMILEVQLDNRDLLGEIRDLLKGDD